MDTTKKFTTLFNLFGGVFQTIQPPQWLIKELQNRLVLFLNHVIQQQDTVVTGRLVKHLDQIIWLQWREFEIGLRITAAGMFELAMIGEKADLNLHITEQSPAKLISMLERGEKPNLYIQGDVALARDISAVIENIHWDYEDDLAKLLGDVPAHLLTSAGKNAMKMLRIFINVLPNSDFK